MNKVPPYQNVVSHGWVLDEHGEQMHKSKGNGVDPVKIANVYGADILRLWVATVEYQQDVRIGDNLIKQVADQYRKIRNTLKFISWNLPDFDPKDEVKEFARVDQYILAKLDELVDEVTKDFNKYDFASAMSAIMTFMSRDLSSFYLDISKDVLYCDAKSSLRRRQTQSVLYRLGETLLRLLNPVLPFTMDEFNNNLPGERKWNAQLLDYPKANMDKKEREALLQDYELLISLRTEVLKALEEARTAQVIGSSQQALVVLNPRKEFAPVFEKFSLTELARIAVVSEIQLDSSLEEGKILVKHHEGHFCERCWNYETDGVEQEDGTYLCHRCHEVVGGK